MPVRATGLRSRVRIELLDFDLKPRDLAKFQRAIHKDSIEGRRRHPALPGRLRL
ncbi:MAG TPA: hypothetical protein VL996_09180 [Methylocella sp.]|nr:hypothetical protein [Methylocella sp.]